MYFKTFVYHKKTKSNYSNKKNKKFKNLSDFFLIKKRNFEFKILFRTILTFENWEEIQEYKSQKNY